MYLTHTCVKYRIVLMKNTARHSLTKSELIEQIPLACCDEFIAVELLEQQRWGSNPTCAHCGSALVYKMTDAKTGERSKRYLWRCRECKKQYTVRIGTVYEESRLDLRHWCYAFWRAATSKKGVAALEIMRHCQISYKSALFLMTRIRFAMSPDPNPPKMYGTVEVDETYVGGREKRNGPGFPKDSKKTPVVALVQRDGGVRSFPVARVTLNNIGPILKKHIDWASDLNTDDSTLYQSTRIDFPYHRTVVHSRGEYAKREGLRKIHTNTVEGYFGLVKRGINGIYHNVSHEYLHRYLWHFDFLYSNRRMNDGERTALVIKSAEGKRMMYRASVSQ